MKQKIGVALLFIANLGSMGLFYLILGMAFGFSSPPQHIGNIIVLAVGFAVILLWTAFYFVAFRADKRWLAFFIIWLVLISPLCAGLPILLIIPLLYIVGTILSIEPKSKTRSEEHMMRPKRRKKEELLLIMVFIPTMWATLLFVLDVIQVVPYSLYSSHFSMLFSLILLPLVILIGSWIVVWKVAKKGYSHWVYFLLVPILFALTMIFRMGNGFIAMPIQIQLSLILQLLAYGTAVFLVWKKRKE
ncbi:putative membrane protein [Sporosarcina luteola]|nr:putative membrane protein [Sporosarcina luteola]